MGKVVPTDDNGVANIVVDGREKDLAFFNKPGDGFDMVDVVEFFLLLLVLVVGLTLINGVNTFGAPCLAAELEFDSAGLLLKREVLTLMFIVLVIL